MNKDITILFNLLMNTYSMQSMSERRSFFRERNKSAAQFFWKERKVSAARKNWWARAQNALFFN